ncbi:MAG: hypothetical protein ACLQU3_23160 [Limisphaerales bacterium]
MNKIQLTLLLPLALTAIQGLAQSIYTPYSFTTLAGQAGFFAYGDGTGTNATFNAPEGVAVDTNGNVYVADYQNDTIREVTPAGVVTTIAGKALIPADLDGMGTNAAFFNPLCVALDSVGNLYVGDGGTGAIRKITPVGTNWMVTTLVTDYGLKSRDPEGLAVDTQGNVYVANGYDATIDKVTPAGVVTVLLGHDGVPGTSSGYLGYPTGVAFDTAGNLYVVDNFNCIILRMTPGGAVTTLAGATGVRGSADGTGSAARFNYPNGVAVDTNWMVTTLAGVPGSYGSADGAGSDAQFYYPYGVAVDTNGNVYVADSWNSTIRKGTPRVVQLRALEVTQVIQDWNNSIPLIQGKETYVRAHLYLDLPPGNSGPVTVSGARLIGAGPAGPLPGSPISPIPPGQLTVQNTFTSDPAVRGQFSNSLNFRLPPEWLSGAIALQLAWGGGLDPNVGPPNHTVPASFVPAAVPQVEFVAVNWYDTNGMLVTVGDDLYDMPRRVLSCYPVASGSWIFLTNTAPATGHLPSFTNVNHLLKAMRFADITEGVFVGNRIYHGAVPPEPGRPTNNGYRGWADSDFPVSSSLVPLDLYNNSIGGTRHTVSHEIGHNLGLFHDVSAAIGTYTTDDGITHAEGECGEGGPKNYIYPLFQDVALTGPPTIRPALGPMDSGFDSLIFGLDTLTLRTVPALNPVVSPYDYFDMMSYCNGSPILDRWPSSFTYTNLLNSINTNFIGPPPAPPKGGQRPKGGGGAETYLLVRGTVDFNAATAQFLPFLTLSATNTPPAEPSGTNFLLQALDGSGTVLQAIQFAMDPDIIEENNTNLTADFIVAMEADPAINAIRLWYNGVMLVTLTASAHAPTLTLTAPNGGQNFATGAVNVAWSGNDADGDSLTYMVQYSADDGAAWETLVVDWPSQNLQIDSQELAATTNGLMRVTASDGFNTATAQSAATFTVQPHPPRVSINAPSDGSIFVGDVQLFLDASATDMQDGVLNGTNVQWSSNLDGPLGQGAVVNFDATMLSEGYHTITATAIDSAGLTNSAVTHLLELHFPPPQLAIQTASFFSASGQLMQVATLSWPAYYTNYVLQSSASLAAGWDTVTNASQLSVSGNQQTVTVGVSGASSFFRLLFQ